MKYSITFGIALVCALLFTTCNIPDQPEILTPDESGYGKIRIIFAGGEAARTVLPPIVFDRYEYTFTKAGESVGMPRNPGSDGLFTLENGDYTVEVKAYTGNAAPYNTLAATGVSSQFNVGNDENPTEVIVNLTPVSAGTGTFSYTITYPEGAVPEITLQKWPDRDNIDLDPDDLAEGNGITETLELDAGSYLLTILVGKDELYAGKNEAVHVYPTLTTVYTRNFTDDNLIDAILPTVSDYDISGMTFTYDGSAKTVSVTRKANASPGNITNILYGGTASEPVNAGTYAVTFDVEPVIGFRGTTLQAGTMTIGKAAGAAVSAPEVSVTGDNITVSPVTQPTNGQTVQYAVSTTNTEPSSGWQNTTTFTKSSGLNYVFARAAENDNYRAGAASVTTLESVSSGSIEYFWFDEHDSLVTTSGGPIRIITGQSLTITAQAIGYTVKQWHEDGVSKSTSGNTYTFSSALAGKHIVGLFVEKDGKLYNTNITITVENPYTVTFDANGGSGSVTAQNVLPGSAITFPSGSGLSRADYAFGGWNTNNTGTGTNYDADSSYTPTSSITFFAKWNPTYKITFNANGGTGTAPSIPPGLYGTTVTLPSGSGLSKSGYAFVGWNTQDDGTGTDRSAGSSFTLTDNITLYAKWEPTYTITFNANGGSGTPPSVTPVIYNTDITLPSGSGLTKSGYVFGGWNTNSSGTGTNYNAGASYNVSENTILYARWLDGSEADPFPLTAGAWTNGSITSTASGSAVWYSFNVTSGTTYYVWWNDGRLSDGSKTLDVKVSAKYSSGTTIFTEIDDGYATPRQFTASSDGTVKIKVEPYTVTRTGTFAVVFSTNSTRP
jgi:uncharacterized repeat protein (TIGR02543 family)